jgi:hypothetical protein
VPDHLLSRLGDAGSSLISEDDDLERSSSDEFNRLIVWKVKNMKPIIDFWGKIGPDKLTSFKLSFRLELEGPLGEFWKFSAHNRAQQISTLSDLLDFLTIPILRDLKCFQLLSSGLWVFVDNGWPIHTTNCHALVRLVMCGIALDGRTRVQVPWSFWRNLYAANSLYGPLDTFIDEDPTREFLNAFRRARLFDTVPFIAMHRIYMKEFHSQLGIVS